MYVQSELVKLFAWIRPFYNLRRDRVCTTRKQIWKKDYTPDVDQIEDVLLEAGASKAHTGVQELGPNT